MGKTTSISMIIIFILSMFGSIFIVDSVEAPTISSGDTSLSVQGGTMQMGETITVSVTVTNVVNLMSWRIRLFYDVSLVNCTAAWLPTENVFAGKNPFFGSRVGVRDNRWCVQVGSSIVPFLYGTFNGSGALCKLNFTAQQEVGISTLEFSEPYGEYTFLMYATPPNYTETGYISIDEVSDGVICVVEPSSPTITVVSPENRTYAASSVPLNFTLNKPTSWIGYSLDAQHNVAITGNTTLSGLSYGSHNITVYANDTSGNIGSSGTVFFTVRLLGDLNSDRRVDIFDLVAVLYAYGSSSGDANWNPLADVNQNSKIDVLDVVIVVRDYGKTWK